MYLTPAYLRAGLDYSEEVHQSTNNFNPHTSLFEAKFGMVDNMGDIYINLKLEFSEGQVFFSKALPKTLGLWRTPLAKSVAMLLTMSLFHPCLKFFTGEVLAVV